MQKKKYPYKLHSIPTIGDGSCFLHAVIGAISPCYKFSSHGEKIRLVRQMRKELSLLIDEKNRDGKTYYEILSRGQLKNLSEHLDEVKLENMKKFLDSNSWFSHLYVEFISEVFEIDIYIVDYNTKRLYNLGDDELFYKDRNSIIIGYDGCHFETLSVLCSKGKKRTYFSGRSPVILKLKNLLYIK
jgi:hypothetical protein